MRDGTKRQPANRYQRIIERIFDSHYRSGMDAIAFDRNEIVAASEQLGSSCPRTLVT